MIEYNPKDANNFVVMNRDEVRRVDSWAIGTLGLPGAVLMENAGRSCAELIIQRLAGRAKPKVCIFCGTGNNGGDGFVIARHLANAGTDAKVAICGNRARIKGDALLNLTVIERMKIVIEQMDMVDDRILPQVKRLASGCDMLVDAIFGTGLTGELRNEYAELIAGINAQKLPIVAVDIPSGLDCDTAMPLPVSIEAECTVTFVAVKKGFAVCPEAAKATGRVFVASIGAGPLCG